VSSTTAATIAWRRERDRREPLSPEAGASTGAQAPAFSDEALALRFAERHAGELRYVAAWGRWCRGREHIGDLTTRCALSTSRDK
jgi:hypothetical protein